MVDVNNTLSLVDNGSDPVYFCSDDLYGYYTFDEIADILVSLALRLGELRSEYDKKK